MTRQTAARLLSEGVLGFRAYTASAADYVQGLSPVGKCSLGVGVLFALAVAYGVLSPARGRIVPVGPSVTEAYRMLQSSASGRKLIGDVCRASRGDIIYLTLGDTERDRLADHTGWPARGVTRAITLWDGNRFSVRTVTVIVNKDYTWINPGEILKSLAFELENVLHLYRNPAAESGIDSPHARLTQAKVMGELGIRW
jgi:hypothetical protein